MTTFQFYKKQNALVHLATGTLSSHTEKKQLIEQGFELVGGIVEAETSYAAFNKFKALHLQKSKQFSTSHLFVNTQ